jgi:glycosyltransferase involved in cell wall biosynthesis
MRILQVADHYPPETGGLADHVERLAHGLQARGHDVTVFTVSRTPGTEISKGVEVVRERVSLDSFPVYEETSPPFHPPWPDPTFRRSLGRELERLQPDVVHAHGWSVFSAALATRHRRLPIVCTLHDYNTACPKKSLLRYGGICEAGRGWSCATCDSAEMSTAKRIPLAGALTVGVPWLARRVTAFVAVSGYVARRSIENGLDRRSVSVIPNFITPPKEIAGSASAPVGTPYVLYVGPEASHKGHDVLLEAFRRLGHVDYDLILVGGRLTRRLGDPPRAVFLGRLRGEELAMRYRQAAVVVVPSTWADPCPTVALEAMAWGRPVIGSDAGGLAEIIVDGSSGILVPAGDADALATAIRSVMSNPPLREAMGAEGRRRIDGFATTHIVPQLEAIYEQTRQIKASEVRQD